MRRIIALVATLCLLLTVVSVPAVAETEGTDWSSKEKLDDHLDDLLHRASG